MLAWLLLVTARAEDPDVLEVVVEARAPGTDDTHATATLDAAALDRAAGQDLAETVSRVPGVAVARGTSDSTKPIIRGQYERRLLLLFDGVRHESQKWGLDHAPEIDPFAAGSIRVIKGASGVRYGPDAIGGGVLVEPPPLRTETGIGGQIELVGVSNGLRGIGAFRLDAAPEGPLSFRLEGNAGRGAAVSTPDYVLGNTASAQWNGGATARWQRDTDHVAVSFHHYDFRGGVCYCVASSTPADFLGQLDRDRPVNADVWTRSYRIDRPYQTVTHDLALADAAFAAGTFGVVHTLYAFQENDRREYDTVRTAVTGPQYDFVLRTHSLDVRLEHNPARLGDTGQLEGAVGASGSFQENVYRGLPLVPNYRSFAGGTFVVERLDTGPLAIEIGGRVDHLSRTAFLTASAFERHLGRQTLGPDDCTVDPSAARCKHRYDAATASLGGVWHAGEVVDVRLDLSSASRFPNADELYLNGSAPTLPVYALGDPSLGVETTRGVSPTVGLRLPWIEGEASVYWNDIDDYVYFAPELGADGRPAIDVTIQGAFPRYSFRPIDARFTGFDGGLTVAPDAPVSVEVQGAVVRAQDRATGRPLVLIPPDRVSATVHVAPPIRGAEPWVDGSVLYVAKQVHVDPDADLAPPPDAFLLVDAAFGVEVPLGGRTLKFGLEASNLLNTRYRDYTSLLRTTADEPGRSLRARIELDFQE